MKKRISTKKFDRKTNARKHLWQGLVIDLVIHGKITTTLQKAKLTKRIAEKLVTKARVGSLAKRREIYSTLSNIKASKKLIDVWGPLFKNRHGGYLRLIKIPSRLGDNAQLAVLQWVQSEREQLQKDIKDKKVRKVKKAPEKINKKLKKNKS